jgi:hypothetical protein
MTAFAVVAGFVACRGPKHTHPNTPNAHGAGEATTPCMSSPPPPHTHTHTHTSTYWWRTSGAGHGGAVRGGAGERGHLCGVSTYAMNGMV